MASVLTTIRYHKGDATSPVGADVKLICHVCNDVGAWGRGFVLALSRRWAKPEQEYRAWHTSGADFRLGAVQFVRVESDIWVANMVARRGIRGGSNRPPIRYDSVATCLQQAAIKAQELGASIHMPRIGCGLAGGQWSEVEPLILDHVCVAGIEVNVYDLEIPAFDNNC